MDQKIMVALGIAVLLLILLMLDIAFDIIRRKLDERKNHWEEKEITSDEIPNP